MRVRSESGLELLDRRKFAQQWLQVGAKARRDVATVDDVLERQRPRLAGDITQFDTFVLGSIGSIACSLDRDRSVLDAFDRQLGGHTRGTTCLLLIHLADATEEVIETKSSLSALRPIVCELYVVAIREAARLDIESVLDSSLFGKASRKALGNARPSVKFLERMEALMRVVLEVVTYH